MNGGKNYGRVQISVDGVNGTVCDYGWGTAEADVVCKQLGFKSGVAYNNAYYGQGSSKSVVWMSGLACYGNENSLFECAHRGWNQSVISWSSWRWRCRGHIDDAGVYCYTSGRESLIHFRA